MAFAALLAQSLLNINPFVSVEMIEIWKQTFGYVWIFFSEFRVDGTQKTLEALMLFLSHALGNKVLGDFFTKL